MTHNERQCAICRNTEAALLYEPLSIVRCKTCGFVYIKAVNPPVDYANLEKYGDYLKDTVRLAAKRRNAGIRLDLLKRTTSVKGILLDIGASEGIFLDEAHRRGYTTLGCEPHTAAAKYAQNIGQTIISRSFQDCYPELLSQGPFSVITLFHVLEHIPDPGASLRMLCPLMNNDSRLVIEVPDFNSPLSRIYGFSDNRISREHVSYFTRFTLLRLLENSGFKVIVARRTVFDAYHQSLYSNCIRLPVFSLIYKKARIAKHMFQRFVLGRPQKRKTLDDNIELWQSGAMSENNYLFSRQMGMLVELLDRGDDLFFIAQKK